MYLDKVSEICVCLKTDAEGLFPACVRVADVLRRHGTITGHHAGHYGGGVGFARFMVKHLIDGAEAIAALP